MSSLIPIEIESKREGRYIYFLYLRGWFCCIKMVFCPKGDPVHNIAVDIEHGSLYTCSVFSPFVYPLQVAVWRSVLIKGYSSLDLGLCYTLRER